jgi:hypothetical protein
MHLLQRKRRVTTHLSAIASIGKYDTAAINLQPFPSMGALGVDPTHPMGTANFAEICCFEAFFSAFFSTHLVPSPSSRFLVCCLHSQLHHAQRQHLLRDVATRRRRP